MTVIHMDNPLATKTPDPPGVRRFARLSRSWWAQPTLLFDQRPRAVDADPRECAEHVRHGDDDEHGRPAVVVGDVAEDRRGGDQPQPGDGVVEGKDRGRGPAPDVGDYAPARREAPVAEELDEEQQAAEDVRIAVKGQRRE